MNRREFIMAVALGVVCFGLGGCMESTRTSVAKRPNVVIIYGDDVGFGDVGAYGAKMIPTPNIDRLASESLMFMDGHCTAATCSPS